MPQKLIFIFPGQASQYVGMGLDLYEDSAAARSVMDRITRSDELKHILDLCFNGPEDLLTRTDNVQPAITAVSLMALAAIREAAGDDPDLATPFACAGHSLGEYAAHAAAGNIPDELTMKLVRFRGRWMNEASQPPNPPGAMVAVMGMKLEIVENLVDKLKNENISIANINSPGQVILSGEKRAVEKASELAMEAGAKRCVMLNVSGAWHSPLMNSAREMMGKLLFDEINPEKVYVADKPFVVANATADIVRNVTDMRKTLTDQITSPVRWEACVRRLIEVTGYPGLPSELTEEEKNKHTHAPLFVEVGPGKVLKGLMKGIDRKLDVMNVEDMDGVRELIEFRKDEG